MMSRTVAKADFDTIKSAKGTTAKLKAIWHAPSVRAAVAFTISIVAMASSIFHGCIEGDMLNSMHSIVYCFGMYYAGTTIDNAAK